MVYPELDEWVAYLILPFDFSLIFPYSESMSLVKKQMVVLLCFLLFVAFLIYANKYITQLQGPLSPAHATAFAEYKKNFGPLLALPGIQAGENNIKLTVNKSKGAFGLAVITSFQDQKKNVTIPAQYSKPMRVQKDGYWVEFTPAFSQKKNNFLGFIFLDRY